MFGALLLSVSRAGTVQLLAACDFEQLWRGVAIRAEAHVAECVHVAGHVPRGGRGCRQAVAVQARRFVPL